MLNLEFRQNHFVSLDMTEIVTKPGIGVNKLYNK